MDSPTLSSFPTEIAAPDTFDFPSDAGEFTYQQEYSTWHRQTDDTLERMSLDRANAFRDVDLSQTGDPDHAMRLITNTAFMEFLTGSTMPAEEDNLYRHMARNSIASQVFGGKGAESEEALGEQITAHYQGRRDRRDLVADLRRTALLDGALPTGEAAGFNAWNEAAMTKPGYDKKRLADYQEEFHELRLTSSRIVDRFRPDLKHLWDLNRMDGNVYLAAHEIFERLDPADREDFKRAFAIRAKALPKNEQATLVRNLTKTWGEMMFDQGKNTYVGAKLASLSITPTAIPYTGIQAPVTDPQQWLELDAGRKKAKAEFLQQVNFAEELLRSVREDYNPTLSADGSGKPPGFWEDALYKTPGTVSTAFTMFVPVAGPTSMAFAMNGTAYQTFHDRFRETMDEATASEYASTLAPIAAIPQMALERLGFNAVFRRVPGYSKLVGDLSAHFTNRFLQVGARTAAGLTAETSTELLEEVVSHSVQSLAHFTDEKIPATRWLGKEGAWASIAEQAPGIAVTLVPLAFFGGVRGAHYDARKKDLADARASAFSSASDSELEAFGGTAEAISGIQQAKEKGGAGLHEAIDRFMDTRDPDSESAKAAVVRLRASHEEQEQAGRILQGAGILPKAVQHSDGSFTLYDTTTGEEIAKATDWESATRVATTHANMVEERDSDRIAAVASAYQAAQFSGDWSKLTGQQTETHLDFGTSETTTQAAARSEDHRRRVESQELLDGGDGSITRSVLGESRTTFEQGQARTVNRILDGGSILTIFHEEAHGFRRRAHQNRSLTVTDDIAILRAVDTVLAGKTTREGDKQLRLLPENFDSLSPKDQETAIDEGISRLMEAEVLRTRKGGGVRELPAGIISNNLAALSRVAGDKSVGKYRAFIRAVRAHFGLAIDRASEIRRGLEDGTISRADYEAYLSKLHGSANSQTESAPPLGTSESFSIEGSHGNLEGRPDSAQSSGSNDDSSQAATFVGKVWYAFAKHENLFQFSKSHSQDALEIANELSTPGKPIAAEVVHSDTNPDEFSITFYGSNGYIEVKDAHTDRPHISSMHAGSKGSPGGGGSQLYMAALDWIHNNGKTIRDDPGGLSPINEVRRTSNFLASALRWKTTKHLFPHAYQGIGKWTTNDDINLQKLAIREMKNVRKVVRASRASRGWTFDFENGKFLDAKDNELTEKDLTDAVLRSNPGNRGIGLSTLQRAIITGAALRELHSRGNEVAVVPVVSTLPSSLEGISYSLDSTVRPRLTSESFKSAIVDLIGEEQLRTVQPNASYEDKVKLIDDFSRRVLREGPSPEFEDNQSPDDGSGDSDYSTPDIGQPGGIQVLEQRLANDLLVDTQVRFLGETIQSAEDLAVKAMALRNPMFETFYLFALKPDPNSDPAEQKMIVADVMALTSRIPCVSHAFLPAINWNEGVDQHLAFLKAVGARDYLFLHNHPSGDPEPSEADRFMTTKIRGIMKIKAPESRFHGHIVINHKKFARIEENGDVWESHIPDKRMEGSPFEFDQFSWPRNSTRIGVNISESSVVASLAQRLEMKKTESSQLVGFFTNSRNQVVSVSIGSEQQFSSLAREQLRDYAREQGGAFLSLHAKATSYDEAMDLVDRFQTMNRSHLLKDLVLEISNPDGSIDHFSAAEVERFKPVEEFFGESESREKTTRIQ